MTSKNPKKGYFSFVPIYFVQGCLGNILTRTGVKSLHCSAKNVYKVEKSLSQGKKGQFQMSRHQNCSFKLQVSRFQAAEYILSSLFHVKLVKCNCPKRIFLFWWQKIGKKTISKKWKCSKRVLELKFWTFCKVSILLKTISGFHYNFHLFMGIFSQFFM